jgi:hypothetical protein
MKPFRPTVQLKLDPVCAQIACFLPRFKSTFCMRFPTPHACYTFRLSKRPWVLAVVVCRAAPPCQFSPPLCLCQRSVAKLGDAVLRLVYGFSSPFVKIYTANYTPCSATNPTNIKDIYCFRHLALLYRTKRLLHSCRRRFSSWRFSGVSCGQLANRRQITQDTNK